MIDTDRRGFVFVDRDGTVVVERHHLTNPEDLELLPGAAEGLRMLSGLGLGIILITNQSVIGRGMIDGQQLGAIHDRLMLMLGEHDVRLDGIYHCPHLSEDACRCRKPMPGLLEQAALEHPVDLSQSFVIGDKICDIQLGAVVGATSILVLTGHGKDHEALCHKVADHVSVDLLAAATIVGGLVGRQAAK
jgi:D-glycero-D-manno-heptose 1,7-bisphosphate phosphatase